MHLKLLLLIPLLFLFASALAECELEVCGTELTELKSNLAEIKKDPVQPLKFLKEAHQQCNQTLTCLKTLECEEGARFVEVTSNTCEGLYAMTGDLQSCVEKFYDATYHRKYACVGDHPFLSKNVTKKAEAFKNGAACFEGVIRYECNNVALKFIRNNKDLVFKLITEKPKTSCGIFYELQALECKPILNRLIGSFEEPYNLVEQVQLCSDMETCIQGNTCHYTTAQHRNITDACRLLEVHSSAVTRCYQKLREHKELVNWSSTCLNGSDFFDFSKKASCERLQGKQECVKSIIGEFCGELAVNSYVENQPALLKVYNCDA